MSRVVTISSGNTFEAAAMMAFAVLLLPLHGAVGKYLALYEGISPSTSSLIRLSMQCLVTFLIVLFVSGSAGLRLNHWVPNFIRGLLAGFGGVLFLIAMKYMPFADAIAIFFVEPFILTALSALVLREEVRWPRWLMIIIGFAGALLVIQPNFVEFGFVSLLPMVTATLFAVYMLLNRVYGAHDNAVSMQFTAGIGGAVAVGLILQFGSFFGVGDMTWTTPTTGLALALLVMTGVISVFAHVMIITALRLAPASLFAPFQYLEIVTASLVGFVVFGTFPSLSKWLGIAIIVGSGLFILWRERRLSVRKEGAEPVPPGP